MAKTEGCRQMRKPEKIFTAQATYKKEYHEGYEIVSRSLRNLNYKFGINNTQAVRQPPKPL